MLPKKNRISRKEFPSYKMKGIRAFSPYFSAVFYKNDEKKDPNCHISIVVSKKTAKIAVDRNYLRRRFYDLIGPFLGLTSDLFTAVFYPKKEAKDVSQDILKGEVEKALKSAKLIK